MAEERIAAVSIVVVGNTAVGEPERSLYFLGSYSDYCYFEARHSAPYQAIDPAGSSS